jgi:hypothetical protein
MSRSSSSIRSRRPVSLKDTVVVLVALGLLVTLVATTWAKLSVALDQSRHAPPSNRAK